MRSLLAAALFVSACAGSNQQAGSTTPAPATASAPGSGSDAESDKVCTEETPVGSNIPREVCRTRDQVNDDRDDAQRDLQRPRGRERPRR